MQTTGVAVETLAEKVAVSRQKILGELRKVIVGQDDVVDEVLMSLFCGGHCLITGVPGLAKTLLVKTLSQILDLSFKRIQFTPDLMPADITGTEILDEDHGSRALRFVKGIDFDPPTHGPKAFRGQGVARDQELAQVHRGRVPLHAGVGRYDHLPHLFFLDAVQQSLDL
jgi:MoxR-like ATPase